MSNIADQFPAGIGVYDEDAWLRTSVPIFRPVSSPDGQGGSAITVGATAALTVMADPTVQQGRQIMLVRMDQAIITGDIAKIQHSQFRT